MPNVVISSLDFLTVFDNNNSSRVLNTLRQYSRNKCRNLTLSNENTWPLKRSDCINLKSSYNYHINSFGYDLERFNVLAPQELTRRPSRMHDWAVCINSLLFNERLRREKYVYYLTLYFLNKIIEADRNYLISAFPWLRFYDKIDHIILTHDFHPERLARNYQAKLTRYLNNSVAVLEINYSMINVLKSALNINFETFLGEILNIIGSLTANVSRNMRANLSNRLMLEYQNRKEEEETLICNKENILKMINSSSFSLDFIKTLNEYLEAIKDHKKELSKE